MLLREYENINNNNGIKLYDALIKRGFDIIVSFIGISLSWWLILIAWLIASIETRSNGFFTQKRIGQFGRAFSVIKIKTMHDGKDSGSTVTTLNDPRITISGQFFRNTKIDELPQLINVFLGQMSFVGPRPDVPGYADQLKGNDKIILTLRPGITGPATLHYRKEEALLATQSDPEKFNKEVIYPHKLEINKKYIVEYSFQKDIKYIIKTVFNS